MAQLNILILVGSSRTGSYNRKLADVVAAQLPRHDATAQIPDLRALDLPLFDQDLEAESGIPAAARALREQLLVSDALVICTPEYNGFPPPVLKNAIDWMSRPDGDVQGLDAFRDKPALVLSASPGGLGGLRSLTLTRQLLSNIGMLVMPETLAVSGAGDNLPGDGQLKNDRFQASLSKALTKLCERSRALTR